MAMNPEQLPTLENEAITTNQQHLETNVPEAIEHGGTLEGLEGDAEAIQYAHEAAIKSMIENNPIEKTIAGDMDANGVLLQPEQFQTSKSIWPSWLRKAAVFTGIASAGLLASNQAKAQHAAETKPVTQQEASIPKISRELKDAWGEYLDFLDGLHLRGSKELDHNGKGKEMLKLFISKHPGTPLTLESVRDIQAYFQALQKARIEEIKKEIDRAKKDPAHFKVNIEGDISPDSVMTHISKPDDWPGSQSTQYKFPTNDETVSYNNQLTYNVNKDKNLNIQLPGKSHKTIEYATIPGEERQIITDKDLK